MQYRASNKQDLEILIRELSSTEMERCHSIVSTVLNFGLNEEKSKQRYRQEKNKHILRREITYQECKYTHSSQTYTYQSIILNLRYSSMSSRISHISVHLWSTNEIISQLKLSLTRSRENIRILASAISRAPLKHESIKYRYPQ